MKGGVSRRKMCTGKVRYRDEIGALMALASTARASREREETRYYKCPLCCGWHLTSKGRRC